MPPLERTPTLLSLLRKSFSLLNGSERRKSIFLLGGIIVGGVTDVLGLASVLPVIGALINPDEVAQIPVFSTALEYVFGVESISQRQIVTSFSLLLILAFTIKATISLVLTFWQTRFSFAVAERMTSSMWDFHFASGLEKMRNKNTGLLLAEINGWPTQFAQTFISGSLLTLSEMIVAATIIAGLLFYDPTIFLSLFLLMGAGALLVKTISSRRLSRYSNTRKKLEPRTNANIANSVRGFIELISYNALAQAKSSYVEKKKNLFGVYISTTVLTLLPSRLYELLAVTGIAACAAMLALLGYNDEAALELISVLAISSYRVMPSMSRMSSAYTQMQSQRHVIEAIQKASCNLRPEAQEHVHAQKDIHPLGLQLEKVSFRYENDIKLVLNDLSFNFEPNLIYAIVGASGSGKTTLVTSILGLNHLDSGHIQLSSDSSKCRQSESSREYWLNHFNYLSQNPYLFEGTLLQNILLHRSENGIDKLRISRLIEALELTDLLGANPLQFRVNEGGENLSGGQQQRIALIRALYELRPILLLDEATSALDSRLKLKVMRLLREEAKKGCTVLFVTHDLELSALCDHRLEMGSH